MVAYDARKAWMDRRLDTGRAGARGGGEPGGRIAAVKVVFPWTKPNREPAKPARRRIGGSLVTIGLSILAIVFGLVFAVRNLRKNRGDKKGALRLACVVCCLVADLDWDGPSCCDGAANGTCFLNALSDAAFTGLLLWLLYLALEPAVRARWPQALVTWNRLLAGRFGDAQLGAHILTGAAIGLMLYMVLASLHWLDYQRTACHSATIWTGPAVRWRGLGFHCTEAARRSEKRVYRLLHDLRISRVVEERLCGGVLHRGAYSR